MISNEDAIVVTYDPFARESLISIFKNKQQELVRVYSEIGEMCEALVGFAYGKDIYNFKIHAPLAYIYEIKRMVEEIEKSLYSANKINIEVI